MSAAPSPLSPPSRWYEARSSLPSRAAWAYLHRRCEGVWFPPVRSLALRVLRPRRGPRFLRAIDSKMGGAGRSVPCPRPGSSPPRRRGRGRTTIQIRSRRWGLRRRQQKTAVPLCIRPGVSQVAQDGSRTPVHHRLTIALGHYRPEHRERPTFRRFPNRAERFAPCGTKGRSGFPHHIPFSPTRRRQITSAEIRQRRRPWRSALGQRQTS